MAKLLLLFFVFSWAHGAEIFDVDRGRPISWEEFLEQTSQAQYFILGETHYSDAVGKLHGEIISRIAMGRQGLPFTVGWEFLNFVDQEKINESFQKFRQGALCEEELLEALGPSRADSYLPFLKATAREGGNLLGLNAPWTWKREIIKNGLSSLPPEHVPWHMELGDDQDRERFNQAMGPHPNLDEETLSAYFLAQSYTDSVMADAFVFQTNDPLRLMIVGHFHSDYFGGVGQKIQKLSPNKGLVVLKVDDVPPMPHHPKWGPVADYIFLADQEP